MTDPVGATAAPDASGDTDPTRLQRWADRLAALRMGRLGLRTRVLLMFSLGSLLLAVFLSGAAYSFTRSSLVAQRDQVGVEGATRNATLASAELAARPVDASPAINQLQAQGIEQIVIRYQDTWRAGSPLFTQNDVPASLVSRVVDDRVAARITVRKNGEAKLIVGIPLAEPGAAYFEAISMADVDETLDSVALSLFFGAIITSLFGVVLGWFVSNRAVRPLAEAAQAAQLIAGGRLDTRLEATDDQDLRLLANSFNDMASALQARVERDARFASDVSHELRSPLMTLAASVEVMQARRDEMPERAQIALDLLVSDVSRFQGLVEDLLEISRFDAGAIRLNRDELLAAEFVRQAIAVSSAPTTPVHVTERCERLVMQGDRRRLARVVANLIDNARLHGGGGAEVFVSEPENEGEPLGHVWIAVEDHGPGVPEDERELVFERFARGGVAGRRSSSDGAGLGLALVDEHIRLHGGRVWVEDRSDGEQGARFVLELPAEEVGI